MKLKYFPDSDTLYKSIEGQPHLDSNNLDVRCLLVLGYATDPIEQYGGRFDLNQVCYQETYGQAFQL